MDVKKLVVLFCVLLLSACGTMGVGSNHRTMVYNNSNDDITVTADSGIYKIKPENSLDIYSKEQISIHNKNSACPQVNVERRLNVGAICLDVFPGFLLGIIPIFVDAVTSNLYHMPDSYSYTCSE